MPMKNTIATPGPRWLPSPPLNLRPSCHLDRSILHYCARNRTIYTMVFLWHYGHHDRKRGRWDCSECKWIFIAIFPHKSLGQFPHCCSFLWSPRLGAQDAFMGTFDRLHTRFDNQPDMVEFEWVELARQSSSCGNSHDCVAKQRWWIREWNICHPLENEQMWTRWWLAEETEMLHTIRWCSYFSNELII